MAESLFDIFGDHLTRQVVRNVSRQPLTNVENMGKTISSGPVKPNEPVKKGAEPKKTFLANSVKALQSTPARQVFTPRPVNVGTFIYNDTDATTLSFVNEDIKFTKPTYKYDNYHKDLLDYLPVSEPQILRGEPEIKTPPPAIRRHSFDFNCSYEDEFFTDDFSIDSIPDDELGLPDIF